MHGVGSVGVGREARARRRGGEAEREGSGRRGVPKVHHARAAIAARAELDRHTEVEHPAAVFLGGCPVALLRLAPQRQHAAAAGGQSLSGPGGAAGRHGSAWVRRGARAGGEERGERQTRPEPARVLGAHPFVPSVAVEKAEDHPVRYLRTRPRALDGPHANTKPKARHRIRGVQRRRGVALERSGSSTPAPPPPPPPLRSPVRHGAAEQRRRILRCDSITGSALCHANARPGSPGAALASASSGSGAGPSRSSSRSSWCACEGSFSPRWSE